MAEKHIFLSHLETHTTLLARLAKKGLGQQAGVCFTYLTPAFQRGKKTKQTTNPHLNVFSTNK